MLALTPSSGCRLIHVVIELLHADVDALHAVANVDVLVPPAAVLGGPRQGLLMLPFILFYLFFPLYELRHRVTNRPATQAFCQITAK